MVVNIIEKLMETGFSSYEARIYISLLKENPATAYETARSSGIPTSKVYEVLGKLLEKGIVREIAENRKKRYIPVEPAEFLLGYKNRMNATLGTLDTELGNIRKETRVAYIYTISDYAGLMNEAENIIGQADESILISCWKEEVDVLSVALAEKEKKGVRIAMVHFGNPSVTIGQVFKHPIEDTIYEEKGGRGIVIVTDSGKALIGTIYTDNSVEGAWSMSRGFVTLAEDYIKHDIYIMKIVKRFDQSLIDTFGKKYAKLRDIFTDKEVVR